MPGLTSLPSILYVPDSSLLAQLTVPFCGSLWLPLGHINIQTLAWHLRASSSLSTYPPSHPSLQEIRITGTQVGMIRRSPASSRQASDLATWGAVSPRKEVGLPGSPRSLLCKRKPTYPGVRPALAHVQILPMLPGPAPSPAGGYLPDGQR